jgi:hypothetical protein
MAGAINLPLPEVWRLAPILITTDKSLHLSGIKYMQRNITLTAPVCE